MIDDDTLSDGNCSQNDKEETIMTALPLTLPKGLPGADLPACPHRICRVDDCEKRYRSPGYLCGRHGGGRCQATGCEKVCI